jgi:hypothetical protein
MYGQTETRLRSFCKELTEQTDSNLWKVVEVAAPPSQGPFGPLSVRMICQRAEIVFSLDLLSCYLIKSTFPHAYCVSSLSISASTSNEFKRNGRISFLPSSERFFRHERASTPMRFGASATRFRY